MLSGDSSLSAESTSQTQSPWKLLRGLDRNDPIDHGNERPQHQLSSGCYFFYSPSMEDTNKQEALEVQALTLEPKSGHYADPVVVCDFTALYPSLVIAYNLCYSTCAGKLDYHSTRVEMRRKGATTGRLGPFAYPEAKTAMVLKQHMKSFDEGSDHKDRAYVAPTGTIFVSESIVRGVLPQVLDEILSTRAMLKKAAKIYRSELPGVPSSILRQLEARQLGKFQVIRTEIAYRFGILTRVNFSIEVRCQRNLR